MRRLWEHVERLYVDEPERLQALADVREIAGERAWVARDIDNPWHLTGRQRIQHRPLASGARRIDHQPIEPLDETWQRVLHLCLHDADIGRIAQVPAGVSDCTGRLLDSDNTASVRSEQRGKRPYATVGIDK